MPTILITKPDITEEENARRKEIFFDILSDIAYQDEEEED